MSNDIKEMHRLIDGKESYFSFAVKAAGILKFYAAGGQDGGAQAAQFITDLEKRDDK